MKKFLENFAKGIYDSLSEKEETNVFLYSEIENYVVELFRSIVNKSSVLIGILIVSVFFDRSEDRRIMVLFNRNNILVCMVAFNECDTTLLYGISKTTGTKRRKVR